MDNLGSICIWGLGFLGYHSMVRYASVGLECWVIDHRVHGQEELNKRVEQIRQNYWNDRLEFSPELENIHVAPPSEVPWEKIRAHFICLPLENIGNKKENDLIQILEMLYSLSRGISPLIVLESSFPPETVDKTILPFLNSLGWILGRDFFLVCCPRSEWDLDPKVAGPEKRLLGYLDEKSMALGSEIVGLVDEVFPVNSFFDVEMMRASEGAFKYLAHSFGKQLACAFSERNLEKIYSYLEDVFQGLPISPAKTTHGVNLPLSANFIVQASRRPEDLGLLREALTTDYRLVQGVCEKFVVAGIKEVLILGLSYKKDSRLFLNGPIFKFLKIFSSQNITNYVFDPMFKNEEVFEITGSVVSSIIEWPRLHPNQGVLLLSPHTAFSSLQTKFLVDSFLNQGIVFDLPGLWKNHRLNDKNIHYFSLSQAGWS